MSITVGFIGAGNMGGAIIRGLARCQDIRLTAYDPDSDRLKSLAEACGVEPAGSPQDVASKAGFVVLAVKPQVMKSVSESIAPVLTPRTCLLSIAAGITSTSLREWTLGVCPVIRVMPNTPALVGAGVFALCLDDPLLTPDQKEEIQKIFASQGQVHVLPERLFDAFTAVVGSGPAYVYYVMESLVDAAVTMGIPRPAATDMVTGLFAGSVKLAEGREHSLGQLREMVCSPGGSTIVALNRFDSRAVKGALIEGVLAACKKNKELGG